MKDDLILIKNKGISVVIPNYNGRQLLPEILPLLYDALVNTGMDCEIILSDDCSTDDTVDYIKNDHPQIKIIESVTNRGFSPTINKGIFKAVYDHVLLLNSDVKLSPDYFKNLLPYFDQEDTFGVMGRIIGWDDDNIQDGGKYPAFHGVKIKTSGNYIPLDSKTGDRMYSMYLSGANAFVSREKLILLGGFDELFAPFYVEDFELSLRAWRMGFKCYYEHNAICRHKISTTIKSKSSKNFVKKIYYRNKMFLHAIHLNKTKSTLWYLQLIPETLLHFFTGRWWFFGSLKLFFASGKEIKKSKEKFERKATDTHKLKTVKTVTNEIILSLENYRLKRLN
jgi:GT2 family glycosyltransferase